jgi:hypothetical protein
MALAQRLQVKVHVLWLSNFSSSSRRKRPPHSLSRQYPEDIPFGRNKGAEVFIWFSLVVTKVFDPLRSFYSTFG